MDSDSHAHLVDPYAMQTQNVSYCCLMPNEIQQCIASRTTSTLTVSVANPDRFCICIEYFL